MRFKRLEITGFKSFPQKTSIHFESGVTAIVGPNGSGKSNIVDAIRWVLGEHNPRDVRAPRLEDVIFNGTDTRAPLSMAEVHLTIDNAEGRLPISFSEVTISRRVYRSGESECFINKAPCRLKDIQELFLGTGLGSGTYAIIEQGHIDMILSSKPDERRVVFEEASGVSKYLVKKKETIRRLDETEEHLVRIADITGEIKRQVSALERAANKARQYKTQWEEVKQLELRLAVDELRSGESRHRELEGKLGALNAQRETLEAQKQGQMASLEACNSAVSAVQQKLQELRTKVVECGSQIEQHASQLSLKRRWIDELTVQGQELEKEVGQLRERFTAVDAQLARVSGGEAELRTQLETVQGQLGQGSGELPPLIETIERARHTAQSAKTELFEAAAEASHQRNALAGLTAERQGLEARLARLDEGRTQRTARLDDLRARVEATTQECATLRSQHDETQHRVTTTQGSLDAASARRHELSGQLHQLRDQLANERARVALSEDLWRRYEGFSETVKTLMSQAVDGLVGPLVDLVQATPGHEEMVEAALGPLAEALVVRDRQALARCREVLATQRLEGCRFLVLSDCPVALAMEATESRREGVLGAVKEFVRAESKYQPLVDWILNDSWVIDDLQRLLSSPSAPRGRLVSSQGDRWDRRSWRFGGGRVMAHSRLGRKQRWEREQVALEAHEQEFQRVDADATQAEQAWQSLLREQESAKGRLVHITPSLHKLEATRSQLMQETQQVDEEHASCELEVQELTARRDELTTSLTDIEQAVEQAQTRQQEIERSLNEARAQREQAESRKQELLVARAHVEATQQSLTDRLDALRTRTQEVTSDRTHLTQQIDAKTTQRQEAATRSAELTQQLETHRTSGQQLQEERGQVEAEVARVSEALREAEAKRNQVLPQVMAVEQQVSALMQQIQEQGQQVSERAFRRSHLVERLRELYQIDEETVRIEQQANPSPLTEEQRTSISEQVQKIRAKLESIGPVSLGSVEEYDELKRRWEFLQTQQQDLTQARDDLKTSITQINRTARTQFRETFEKIRVEFQHYYRRLFQGGEANLIMLDEEDVLETGIDIVARPPGKRLQSISLLSGGERALTAVALLFALFKVKPSPFCILDEIDAPLDEANVDRFTKVLEEFLVLSQFILITHNKKTITKADCLYGVTMEEPGVSKILSAKLTQPGDRQSRPAAPTPVPA